MGKDLVSRLLISLLKAGTKVYVYDAVSLILADDMPFRSLRMVAEKLFISRTSLKSKLDTGKAFKGFLI